MKNNFMKSENFTRWAIRKVSVGVVSAAIASGIFVIVGGGEAHASDKQLDKAPVVETVKPQADENVVTKPTEKAETVETTTAKTKEADKTVEQPVVGTDREAKTEVKENDILSLSKNTVDAPKEDAVDMTTHKTTPAEVKKAVMDNTKDIIDVPAKYLDKANFPGPFTAGVNQVIPYHLFAGDGMLTRLILNSSDKAPWSDNGSAKNPALPPVENLTKGLYFYEVDLAGTQGKQDKELLDLLKANGTQSYKATIKVYGEKDGKADLTNLVALKEVTVNLHKEAMEMEKKPGENMMTDHKKHDLMESNMSEKPMDMQKSDVMNIKAHMHKDMKEKNMNAHMNNDMMKKGMLPKTSAAPEGTMNATNSTNTSTTGIVGLIIASLLGLLGLRRKNEID